MSAGAADLTKDDLDGLMVLMADVRDEIGEAAKNLARLADASPTADLLARIEERLARPVRTPAPLRARRGVGVAVALLAALGGASAGWYGGGRGQGEMRAQARLMGQVDALLVAQGSTLPPALRSALQEVYMKAGFQPPAQRSPTAAGLHKTGDRK